MWKFEKKYIWAFPDFILLEPIYGEPVVREMGLNESSVHDWNECIDNRLFYQTNIILQILLKENTFIFYYIDIEVMLPSQGPISAWRISPFHHVFLPDSGVNELVYIEQVKPVCVLFIFYA